MDLERATEIVVRAFCQSKGVFHPYVPRREGPVWVTEDAPGRKQGSRKIEVFTAEIEPTHTVEAVESAGLGWHFVCDVFADPAEQDRRKAEFKRLGYRALATEWVFVHDLQNLPDLQAPEPAPRLVGSAAEWATIPMPRTMRFPGGDGVRVYASWDGVAFYGRVCSRPFDGSGYVSDLYVPAPFRRRGHGRALMSKLLHGDRAARLDCSLLVASSAGAKLYPLLGYRQIATLAVYSPVQRG